MLLAYLDPAAGGTLIQTIVAAAVALPFILRGQIARGLNRVRSRKASTESEDQRTPPD
jgi:hypothetical protein